EPQREGILGLACQPCHAQMPEVRARLVLQTLIEPVVGTQDARLDDSLTVDDMNEALAVWADRQWLRRRGGSGAWEDGLPGQRVPGMHFTVPIASNHTTPVSAEAHPGDRPSVPREEVDFLDTLRFPYLAAAHHVCVPYQGEDFLAGLRVPDLDPV